MMDDRNLNRAIDIAAGTMMAREPSRALAYSVMARVRENAAPRARRFVWITVAASVVLCATIAIALMSQASAPATRQPRTAPIPVGESRIVQSPIVQLPISNASVVIDRETPPARRRFSAQIARKVVSPAPPPNEMSVIDPIETEPIVLAAIDIPQLAAEATSIETLRIEPLTIEPLAASND